MFTLHKVRVASSGWGRPTKSRKSFLACTALCSLLIFFNLGRQHAQHGARLPDLRNDIAVTHSSLISSDSTESSSSSSSSSRLAGSGHSPGPGLGVPQMHQGIAALEGLPPVEVSPSSVITVEGSSPVGGRQVAPHEQPEPEPQPQGGLYHVVVTTDGSIYNQWQARICFWHLRKLKTETPNSAMGGFTRLLHSGEPDGLMEEMPTVVVHPLPDGIDKGYRVLHRPWAFVQWLPFMAALPEEYILMAEPDHIFLHIPPLWANPTEPAAFPFSYMEPQKPEFLDVITRYNAANVSVSLMAPIGNSPVQMHKSQLAAVVPVWYDLALRMKKDPAADKAFGWIQEMYAFSIASAQIAAGPLQYQLKPEFMLQPPFDRQLTLNGLAAYILHYTYGQDLDSSGDFSPDVAGFFHFDKRDYEDRYPPRGLPLPAKSRWPVIPTLIRCINEATAVIESWAPQMGAPHEGLGDLPLGSALTDIRNASGRDLIKNKSP